MSSLLEEEHDINQPWYPCPCCKTDCDGVSCIFCDYCLNWFHQECAKLSDKRFDILGKSNNLYYKCKFCKIKNKKCSNCNITLENIDKKVFCISCKEWSCRDCLLMTLSADQIDQYITTDLPYFCCDCSIDNYCPACHQLCRDQCIFCNHCEHFLHLKCTKLTRGQGKNKGQNYICHICIKDNLPIGAIENSVFCPKTPTGNGKIDLSNPDIASLNPGCGLCIECDNECLSCDTCPDLQRVCCLCLSCKNHDPDTLNESLKSYNKEKKLFVTHMNARSLTANFDKIDDLIDTIELKPDVIGISETRLSENNSTCEIPGYKFIYRHRNPDSGGAGMYISKSLNYKCRLDLVFDFEGCETEFIEVVTKAKCKNTIIGVIYRHPHENHDTFYSKLSKLFENISKKYSVIICGDININTAPTNSKSIVKDYKNLLLSYGCTNLINKYTRIATDINGKTSKTIIDHIITNLNTNQANSGVIHYHISDHLPVFSVFDLNIQRLRQQICITRRFYNNSGKTKFLNEIGQYLQTFQNNNSILNDPDKALQDLIFEIQSSEDRAFPLRKLSKKRLKNSVSLGLLLAF